MKRKRLTLILFLVALGIVAVGFGSPEIGQAVKRRVIVFQFQNISEDKSLDPLAFGITREIMDDFWAVKRIVRANLDIARKYLALKGIDEADTRLASVGREVAQALRCEYAVVGEINRIGDQIEIKATTVNVRTGKKKVHKAAAGPKEEIFRLIDETSLQVARYIGGYITKKEEAKIRRPPTKSLEAFRYLCKGLMADHEKRYIEARRAFLQAITLDTDYLRAYASLAYTWYHIGDYQRAVKAAKKITEKYPENDFGWFVLGCVEKQYEKAEKAYLRGLAMNPENTRMLNNLGDTYREQGDPDKAIEYLDRGLALDPYGPYLNFNKGNALFDKGLYEEAAKFYKAAYDILPNWQNAHNMRGCCLIELKKYDEALKEFEEELKYYPSDVQAQHNIGQVYFYKRDWAKAEENYRKALNLNRYYYLAHYGLGVALAKQRRDSEAVEIYKRGIALAPHYYISYWALADSLQRLDRLKESKYYWELYLRYDSTSQQAKWARVHLKDIEEELKD